MKGPTVGLLSAILALGLGPGAAQAQKRTGSVPLGDLARQLKAQRAKSTKPPRMFTNDDLVALRTASELPSSSTVESSPSTATEVSEDAKSNQEGSANLKGQNAVIPIEWGKATLREDYIDRMSKVQVVREGPPKDANNSLSVAKLAQHSSPRAAQVAVQIGLSGQAEATEGWAKAKFRVSAETAQLATKAAGQPSPATVVQGGPEEVSASSGEWAKARFRAVQGGHSAGGEPGPVAAPAVNSPAAARQDLGYVERADGKIEAIVAEGEHIGLIEETKEFMKTFHIPAPSPAELQSAMALPQPTPPETTFPEADQPPSTVSASDAGLPAAQGTADVAQLQQPQAPLANNAESESEASLQAQPLAEYAGDQFRPKPPENLQPADAPAFVAAAPEVIANRSSVTPIGYVEKAGGEKQAIVQFQDQVFLVHEGELFAGKYRVLRVTALSVEIMEERTEASSAAIDRRRNVQVVPQFR